MCYRSKVIIFDGYEERLSRAGFQTFDDFFHAPGELLDRNRARDVRRLASFPDGPIPYLKRFHSPRGGEGPKSARKEREKLERFRRMGFPGPACAAMGWSREEGTGGGNAFLLFVAPPDVQPVDAYFRRVPLEKRRALIRDLAHSLAKIHQAGIRIPDLMARHVMVRPDGSAYFIDLARIRFRRFSMNSSLKDLARLSTTLDGAAVSSSDRLRFLKHYVERGGIAGSGNPRKKIARRVFAYERNLRRRGRFPEVFALEARGEGKDVLYVNTRYTGVLETAGFTGPAAFRDPPPSAEPLRDIGVRKNFCVRTRAGIFYLKVHREKGRTQRGAGPREWMNHLRMIRAGLPTPVPAAWGWGNGYSFFMSKDTGGIPGDAALRDWPSLPVAVRRKRIGELARTVVRMHRFGFFHRDLYLCHVMVDEERITLIDLQRLEEGPLFPGHRRIKDLAALLFSTLESPVTRTERLRFFRRYLGGGKLGPTGRRLLHRVERKAGRIEDGVRRKVRLSGHEE